MFRFFSATSVCHQQFGIIAWTAGGVKEFMKVILLLVRLFVATSSSLAINYPVFDRIVTIDSMSLSPSQSFQSPYLRTRLLPSCWYSCKQKPSHQAHRPAEAKTCTLTDTTIRNPRVAKSQLFMSNSQIITQYSFSGLCKGFNVGKISCFKVICK